VRDNQNICTQIRGSISHGLADLSQSLTPKAGGDLQHGVARADVHKITKRKAWHTSKGFPEMIAAYPAEPRDIHNYNILSVEAAYGTVMICFFHGKFLMCSQHQTTPLEVMSSTAGARRLGNCNPSLIVVGVRPFIWIGYSANAV
jgi:hypothetical protein